MPKIGRRSPRTGRLELDDVQARRIADAISGSRLATLSGCGHIPSIEAPQEYRQVVLDFLSG